MRFADQAPANKKLSRTFLIRVESVYSELKSAEKRAMDAILSSEEVSESSTISTLSALAGCSDATLVRLSRKLGYSGFPDMKSGMFQTERDDISYPNIRPDDGVNDTIIKFFEIAKNSLVDTEKLLRPEQVQLAANLLAQANNIEFVGSGDAHLVAYSGYLKFLKAGYHAVCSSDFDLELIYASKLTRGDTVVAVSHSGMTRTVCEVVKCAKKHRANIIAITSHPISRLAKLADITILTPTFTENIYNEIISQRIPVLAVMEVLYLLATSQTGANVRDAIQKANIELEINKYLKSSGS